MKRWLWCLVYAACFYLGFALGATHALEQGEIA